jgi:hypothetical protein
VTKALVAGENRKFSPRVLTEGDRLAAMNVEGVRLLAREHSAAAVRVLVKLMNGRKTPAAVRRQAAIDLIALGHPETKAGQDQPVGRSGIVVNILRMADGLLKTIELPEEVQGDGPDEVGGETLSALRDAPGVHPGRGVGGYPPGAEDQDLLRADGGREAPEGDGVHD